MAKIKFAVSSYDSCPSHIRDKQQAIPGHGTKSTNPGLSRRFRDSWNLCIMDSETQYQNRKMKEAIIRIRMMKDKLGELELEGKMTSQQSCTAVLLQCYIEQCSLNGMLLHSLVLLEINLEEPAFALPQPLPSMVPYLGVLTIQCLHVLEVGRWITDLGHPL